MLDWQTLCALGVVLAAGLSLLLRTFRWMQNQSKGIVGGCHGCQAAPASPDNSLKALPLVKIEPKSVPPAGTSER